MLLTVGWESDFTGCGPKWLHVVENCEERVPRDREMRRSDALRSRQAPGGRYSLDLTQLPQISRKYLPGHSRGRAEGFLWMEHCLGCAGWHMQMADSLVQPNLGRAALQSLLLMPLSQHLSRGSLISHSMKISIPHGSVGKNLPAKAGDTALIPGPGRPLEKEMVTPSSTLAWQIPWTENSLVGYSPWGSKRVRHDLETKQQHKENHNRPKEGCIYRGQNSFQHPDYLLAPSVYLSAHFFFPKALTRLPVLKNYCFNGSVGIEHKIFMITLPKIEVHTLVLQRNCLRNQREKRFSRVWVFGWWFFLFIFCQKLLFS